MKIFVLFLMFSVSIKAHVPSLLLPLKGLPITSYFLSNSNISRSVFSELTYKNNLFVLNFIVKPMEKTVLQVFTPECKNIPKYQAYQPSVLVIKGELPWKKQGESNRGYLYRLESLALQKIESNYREGQRPRFYEEYGQMNYWVGGSWKGFLRHGLYSLVVFDKYGRTGNFNISLNEKEEWTPDLYRYVAEILPVIKAGFCDPLGFSGLLVL